MVLGILLLNGFEALKIKAPFGYFPVTINFF